MQTDMPRQPKWKSQVFIELDVEGNWVHCIKRPWVDKGKGQMEMVHLDPDEEEAQARYWADICHLAELNEVIACSFEALVVLLVDRLLVSRTKNLEGAGSEGEEEEDAENVED